MSVPGAEIAREFHALTSFHPGTGYPDHPRRVRAWAGPMREPKPPQFKDYPDLEHLPLPRDLPPSGLSVGAALGGRRVATPVLDLAAISRLLFSGAGVARYIEREDGAIEWFRAAGSSGNLSPLELYLVCGGLGDLAAGIYHYAPVEHALHPISRGDQRTRVAAAIAEAEVPSAYLILTGVPWRTGWKYSERGFRNVYRDTGTMLAQLLPFVGDQERSPLRLAFTDAALAELLGLDPAAEFPVAVVALGPSTPTPRGDPHRVTPGWLGDGGFEFPLVTEVQEAGALENADAVRAWRRAAAGVGVRRPDRPTAFLSDLPLEEAIRRRGSTRLFAQEIGPQPLLDPALKTAAGSVGWDVTTPDRTLLAHAAAVHGVDGLEPGLYWLADGRPGLDRAGDLREEAIRLSLDQRLAGDGAYAAYHCGSVREVTAALGARGYRALLLEAGYVSGRLHLAAHSLGHGASGLTFFDDELRTFLGGSDPQLVTAVGLPRYRPRPGGAPGRPTRITRVPAPAMGPAQVR